jgi:alpha-tubulin suppressor-like RCC1 family protein
VPVEATIATGETQQFVAVLYDDANNTITGPMVTWSSSDENVATVDQTGLAMAVGDGMTSVRAEAAGILGIATLVVEGGRLVVGAGGSHTCALDTSGRAYCWGSNQSGQLGEGVPHIGSPILSTLPLPVHGGQIFASLSVGGSHNCALTPDGAAWCWGLNTSFQSGGFSSSTAWVPSPVFWPVETGIPFASITAGNNHTCALTDDGRAFCWGGNNFGQLGSGALGSFQPTPTEVPGLRFAALDASGGYTCGIATDGVTYCWGANNVGQLGDGSLTNRSAPTPVAGSHAFVSIASQSNSTCALTTDGEAFCWGSNLFGQLGISPSANPRVPNPVVTALRFSSIAPGSSHTCAVATSGEAYCWGQGTQGQLGTGNLTSLTAPDVPVQSSAAFESVSAGSQHSCGITTTGDVQCWGRNNVGQLGNGLQVNQSTPADVMLP